MPADPILPIRPAPDPAEDRSDRPAPPAPGPQKLLSIKDLAQLLRRSVASLYRDDAAGRLPAAVWIGGSKRWRSAEIDAWIQAGLPPRREWEDRRAADGPR
jgi:predicted DNA-binding transcriptional regulator AlpA